MIYGFVLFIVLQVLDICTTYKALSLPNIYEKNPIMRWLMAKLGILTTLISTKTLVTFLIGYLSTNYPNGIVYLLIIIDIGYLFVIGNNLKKIKENW